MSFQVIPAIDLRDGRVVRLRQGDFDQETRYGDDAAEVARVFAKAGARLIHVVDLDGARQGNPVHQPVVAAICTAIKGRAAAEVAGGLRTEEAVAGAFSAGAARVVIGTSALRDPGFGRSLAAAYGVDRVVAAIDVRDGQAIGDGWQADAEGRPVETAMRALAAVGITMFEVTAIYRDGLLEGPDLDLLHRLIDMNLGTVIASGGISSLADLRAVGELGCAGAIVGRAIYEGRIDLGEALLLAESLG